MRPPLAAAVLLCRFGTIAALLLAAASVPQSSFFAIREIAVEGAAAVSIPEVVARASLRIGDPVGAVSPDEIARRVGASPRIRSVGVSITPAGRVLIRLVERRPVAAMVYDGRFVILDRDGVAIAESADPAGLPVITPAGPALPWLRLGTAVPSAAVPESILALAQLPPALRRGGIVLQRSVAGDLAMTTSGGVTVLLGRPRGLGERTAALPQILSAIRARGMAVEYVDVRFTGSVVVKPAGGGPGAGTHP